MRKEYQIVITADYKKQIEIGRQIKAFVNWLENNNKPREAFFQLYIKGENFKDFEREYLEVKQ